MTARKKARTLLAQGKRRMLSGTGRPWRVRLYAPTLHGAGYQIMFFAPTDDGARWRRVLRRATTEAEARTIFDQAEAALDTAQEPPPTAAVRASHTIEALGEAYIEDSKQRQKAPRTIQGRESRLNAHILPTIGQVRVATWRVEHSRQVMEHASHTVFSARGREDLRVCLAAMRKLAWRLGWLDRSIDPLDGLEIGHTSVQGAGACYVDPSLRPETRQVQAMAAAADKMCGPGGADDVLARAPLFGTKIRIAGFGGLRLGEQGALRGIDVFFDRGLVHVNGSWTVPRYQPGFRGPVKNHVIHEVPLPRSLMLNELLPRVKDLLGLPSQASLHARSSTATCATTQQRSGSTTSWANRGRSSHSTSATSSLPC